MKWSGYVWTVFSAFPPPRKLASQGRGWQLVLLDTLAFYVREVNFFSGMGLFIVVLEVSCSHQYLFPFYLVIPYTL